MASPFEIQAEQRAKDEESKAAEALLQTELNLVKSCSCAQALKSMEAKLLVGDLLRLLDSKGSCP